VVSKPEIVEVPRVAYRPLPPELTAPLAEPAMPIARCVADGKPAICVIDALATIPLYQAALRTANDDRARAALLGRTDGTE
jgi:hypothetical protein